MGPSLVLLSNSSEEDGDDDDEEPISGTRKEKRLLDSVFNC